MKPRCYRFTDNTGTRVYCPDCDGAKSFVDEQEQLGHEVRAEYCSFHEEQNLLNRLDGEADA